MNPNKINFFILNLELVGKIKCPVVKNCECEFKNRIYCCTEKYRKCIEYQVLTHGFLSRKKLDNNKHEANSLSNKAVAENCLKKIGESE